MSLVARALEAVGLPTLCVGSAFDIIQAAEPPRAVIVDYPLGHTVGKPFDQEDQYGIVRACLQHFERVESRNAILTLPNQWTDDADWKEQVRNRSGSDSRQPRDLTPRYQFPEDEIAARGA